MGVTVLAIALTQPVRAQAPAPARPATVAAEPAAVPAVVRIARPSEAELAVMRRSFEKFTATADRGTRALLQKYPGVLEVRAPQPNSAIIPALSPQFRTKHEANLAVARAGGANLLLVGDSITDFWRNPEGAYAGKPVLDKYFSQWQIANFGIAGDTTQGVLYRLQHGEGEGFSPRAIMVMIGTNNTARNTAAEIAEGVGAIVLQLQQRFPAAKILLLGIFPRSRPDDPVRGTLAEINRSIQKLDDGQRVFYMDIGAGFLDANGVIATDVMSDGLHPTTKGYEIWANAVNAPLTALMDGRKPPGR
jgi:lysophospholipase L1-like esterase